ncbi:TPA: LOW QUALITY PROTEIN: hypothetical protein N0F65_009840, partial [Lagenidium giganteum]
MGPESSDVDPAAQAKLFASTPGHMLTPVQQQHLASPILEDELVPILTRVYNACWQAGVVPRSFQEASVMALPKVATPRTGLDFRPISLLNTEYKLYARILATRLHAHLPQLISLSQSGFVQRLVQPAPLLGRSIHDAIDLVQIALDQVPSTKHKEATALLLDIAKALALSIAHTSSRRFVRWTSHRHSSAQLQQCTDNGSLPGEWPDRKPSFRHAWNPSGVFILAMEVLHRHIALGKGHKGIKIRLLGVRRTLRIVGFVDGTTLLLRFQRDLQRARRLLRLFELSSGLRFQLAKTVRLRLHPDGQEIDVQYPTQ